ncbi:MAG: SLOG family protein, partial [Planctomycetota bacterium]
MRVVVTGSRDWTERATIARALGELGPGRHALYHGGARGADSMAAHFAEACGWSVVEVPAQWG